MKTDVKETAEVRPITASGRHDPGLRDLFNSFAKKLHEKGKEKMDNVVYIPNDGIVVGTDPDYPAPTRVKEVSCKYKIGDLKRNYALLVLDMQVEYYDCVQ